MMTLLHVLIGWLDVGGLILLIISAKRYIFERELIRATEDELSKGNTAYKLGFLIGLFLCVVFWPIALLGFVWEIVDMIVERKSS